jgi:hypothetical protein
MKNLDVLRIPKKKRILENGYQEKKVIGHRS